MQIDGTDAQSENDTLIVSIERTVLAYNPSLCPGNISGTTFECPAIDIHTARTVHELKPNDIKVNPQSRDISILDFCMVNMSCVVCR